MNVRELVQVHGFAVPYDERALVQGGIIETVSRGAFEKMVARQPTIPVRWDHHDGREIARVSTLFQCAFGLGFAFDLDATRRDSWAYAGDIVAGRCAGVSVQLAWTDSFRTSRGDRIILEATVDHIAVVRKGAYASARCWRHHWSLAEAPIEFREAALKWDAGYRAARDHSKESQCR